MPADFHRLAAFGKDQLGEKSPTTGLLVKGMTSDMMKRLAERLGWRAMLASAIVAIAPTMAVAQETPAIPNDPAAAATPPTTEALTGWNKFCNPDPISQEEGCVVVFRAYQEDRMIGQISLSYLLSEPDNIVLSITVPIGVLLAPGIQLKIDEREPAGAPYVICDPTYCYSESEVDAAFINTLKAGGELTVSFLVPDFENGGAQQLDLPVTLIGFTAAFDGEGRTPEEAQALQDRAEAARQRLIEQQQQLNNP